MLAALSKPIGEFPSTNGTPGIAIANLTDETLVEFCASVQKCSALLSWAPQEPEVFVAYVAGQDNPGEALSGSPVDVIMLPNADGPSQYELNGGYIPSQMCVGSFHADPVNSQSGEFFETTRDLQMPCTGPPLVWSRTYSTMYADTGGPLGHGWTHNYDMRLLPGPGETLQDATVLTVIQENGSHATFHGDPAFGYAGPLRLHSTLEQSPGGGFVFTRQHSEIFEFDTDGRLVEMRDRNDNGLTLSYDSGGNLEQIHDGTGRSLSVDWDGGRIIEVADHTGRTVRYDYDTEGDLVTVTAVGGPETHYSYDPQHRVVEITFPGGGTTQNVYDTEGRLTSQTEPDGGTTTFQYGADSTTITSPSGLVTLEEFLDNRLVRSTVGVGEDLEGIVEFEYNGWNELVSVTDAYGAVSRYGYDDHGNRVWTQDPLGRSEYYTYGSRSELLELRDTQGQFTQFRYDDRGNLIRRTEPSSKVTKFSYDSAGRVTKTSGPGDFVENRMYDQYGYLESVEVVGGQRAEFLYDSLGRLLSVTELREEPVTQMDQGFTTQFTYDARSNLVETLGPRGETTTSVYGPLDNLLSHTDELGNTTTATYNAAGQRTSATDALGRITLFEYGDLGQVVSITEPSGAVTEYDYDERGLQTAVTDPTGATTHYEYDHGGRLTAVVAPAGLRREYDYDLMGRVALERNAADGTTAYTYDALGRVTRLTHPDGTTTRYEYDARGNVTKTIRPDSESRQYAYDAADRVTSITDAYGRTALFAYNSAGLVTLHTDFLGQTTTSDYIDGYLVESLRPGGVEVNYAYDDTGNLVSTDFGNGFVIEEDYDLAGQVVERREPSGITEYEYDALGRLVQITGPTGGLEYEYDLAGDLVEVAYPSGLVVERQYDDAHRLVAVGVTGVGDFEIERDGAGLVTELLYPNGVSTEFEYHSSGLLDRVELVAPNSSVLHELSYTYDNQFLLTGQTLTRGGMPTPHELEVSRDAMGRATELSDGSATTPLSYTRSHEVTVDDLGNELAYATNRTLESLTQPDTTVWSFDYDIHGNRVEASTSASTDTVEYSYNVLHELTGIVDEVRGLEVGFEYSHGLRVSAEGVEDSTVFTESYAWDLTASVPLLVEDDSFAYVYASGSSPVAQVDLDTGEVLFLHGDLVGSTRTATDEVGDVVAAWDYSAYGVVTASTGDAQATRFLFAGEYADRSGLYYLRARFFDPVTAQFLSVDPWVTSTHMPYAYTVGNPFQHTDPLGLAPEDINHWEQAAKAAAAAAPVIAAWNIVTSLAALTTTAGQIQFLAKGWCDYQSNGGGWGGAWASANINLNPMYAAIHSGTNAYDAYTQGRYGDGAIHANEALLITGLTGLGARTPLTLKPKPGNASTPRLPQDAAVNPQAPAGMSTQGRSIGRPSHNQAVQSGIKGLPRRADDIRVNQQQVNAGQQRVGINRPDLQYTVDGKRYYIEYEGPGNPRGGAHTDRILANDPSGTVIIRIVP